MATAPKDDEMHVEEGQDGTATINMPEGMVPLEDNDDEPPAAKADEPEGDDDHPDDTEAVRAARRARRRSKKDFIRKTNEEKDVQLQMLRRENDEFKRRLSSVEQRTQAQDMGQLNKAIEDKQVALEYARMKLAEATNAGDGEAAVSAQELMFDTRQQLQQLTNMKKQSGQPRAEAPRIDPSVQRNAATWIERNNWYKPDLSDTDSKIAKLIDEGLVAEGWNPGTEDYWDELDNRLQKRLPHHYNKSSDRNDSVRSPRNTVGSSGREASAAYGGTNRTTYTLSPERVRAMKDAGAWDNPERKKAMIANFIKYDRTNQGR
jgi:hypothetical protein